ncbi:MAG: hypothetical protein MMC23_008911 [Stictis urceolatum]|nr:hypothetical protein [Stictis urceolata]
MSNVAEPYSSQDLQPREDMMQAISASPGSSLDPNSVLFANPQSPQLSMAQHALSSKVSQRTAQATSAPQTHSFDNATAYPSSVEVGVDSPRDSKSAIEQASRDVFSDTSATGSMMSLGDRQQRCGSGKSGQRKHKGSVDGSEMMSPTSSKGTGTQQQDEQNSGSANDGKAEDERKDGRKPPWSELKTKAGKERKRLPLACIACRRKKIKCSGEKPACKHCVRSRIPCVYKVTARKAAPRTDYMTMLDKRLKRMEERVIRIIPVADPDKMASIGRASVKPPGQQAPKSAGTKKRAADEAFANEIEEWSNSESKADYVRKSSSEDQADSGLLKDGIDYLPSKEIQEHLAETFFDYVYGQTYHLLHKPSFMRRLKAGGVPPVLTLAVCAISARFSPHPELNSEPAFLRGEQWAKPARDIALKRYDEPNITILIVLLILGLHEFGTCRGGRSWMLGGMAMRMAHALQLHRELDHDPLGRKKDKSSELSFTDREIRRRTMWACFLMDRFNSSGTERPMMVHENNIEVQLPIKEAHFRMEIPGPTESLDGKVPNPISPDAGQIADPEVNMGVAAYVVRSIGIWGRVIRYLNLGGLQRDAFPMWNPQSHFAVLKRQVDDFAEKLPERLKYTQDNLENFAAEKLANQYLFLHLVHQQTLLFLHRFAMPTTPGAKVPTEMPRDFKSKSGNIALNAATQISNILNSSFSHMVTAPFAGYCAFVSSTVHVCGMFSKNPQVEATSKRHLLINVKYLTSMKKYWGIFYHMSDNLRNIYQQHANNSRGQARGSDTGKDSTVDASVFEYGNWFNTYPHGVSRTDYQEPAASGTSVPGNDAALGQKSDLQTVEEFFNSVAPPTLTQRKSRKHNNPLSHISKQPHPAVPGLKLETGVPMHNHHRLSRHHDPNAPLVNLGQRPSGQQHSDRMDTSSFHDQRTYQHPPSGFDPSQQHQHTPSSATHPSAFDTSLFPQSMPVSMTDIDRQFVFDAYAADPGNANMLWDFGMNDPTASSNMDVNSPVAQASAAGIGAIPGTGSMQAPYVDASSAWFMPFNLAPPDVGEADEFGGGFGR